MVGRSFSLLVLFLLFWRIWAFWAYGACPDAQVTFSTAPAHPHITRVAMYPALFSLFFQCWIMTKPPEFILNPLIPHRIRVRDHRLTVRRILRAFWLPKWGRKKPQRKINAFFCSAFNVQNCAILRIATLFFKNFFRFKELLSELLHFSTNCEFNVFNIHLKSHILFARNKTYNKTVLWWKCLAWISNSIRGCIHCKVDRCNVRI